MLSTACPACHTPYKVPEHLQGKGIRCKKCQTVFRPGPAAAGKDRVSAAADRDRPAEVDDAAVRATPRNKPRARDDEDTPRDRRPDTPAGKVPKEVRLAVMMLAVAGVLAAAVPAVIWSVMLARGGSPADGFGRFFLLAFTAVFGLFALAAFAAAVLLGLGSRLGLWLAWPVALASLPSFPLGTVVGAVLLRSLLSPGLRDYFRRDRGDARAGGRAPLVIGVVVAGLLVLAGVGFGVWKLVAPSSPPREPAVVQTPAVAISSDYP